MIPKKNRYGVSAATSTGLVPVQMVCAGTVRDGCYLQLAVAGLRTDLWNMNLVRGKKMLFAFWRMECEHRAT